MKVSPGADKKQLKDFYLQNMVAPKARKALEQHLAEEEARNQRRQHRFSRGSHHGDRQ